MMTLSKALAAGQAKDYFDAEYTSAQESYYSEGEVVKGKWLVDRLRHGSFTEKLLLNTSSVSAKVNTHCTATN